MIRKLIKEGEVSIYEKHPNRELAIKVQLFADGDLTVFISNPGGQFNEETYAFLEGAYQKVHKKIQSFDALRRDINRLFSLLATGLASITSIQFGYDSIEQTLGMLGFGFVFPELQVWVKKAYEWVKGRSS